MIIGTFTYDSAADYYRGQIKTLSLTCAAVELRPQTRGNDREPDYRVVVTSPEGDMEVGAAWRRQSDRQREYLSVLLDDPSLDRALSAALFTDKDGKANLVWTRQARQKTDAEVAPGPQQRTARKSAAPRTPAQG